MTENLRLRHVKPDKIMVPEVRVTSTWTQEEYEDFKATIDEDGIQQPLKCILDDGTFWLIDGLHRLEEAKRLGLEKVPIVYKEGELVDALVENLTSNRLRGKTPVSDEIKLIMHLKDVYLLEPYQIAEKTGLKVERIEQRLQVGSAAPEVLSCLEHEQIGLGVAFHLSRLPNQSGQIALLSRLLQATPPATTSEVGEIIDTAIQIQKEFREERPAPTPVIPVKTLACHLCGEYYEPGDMRGINACATCHGLARDYIQQLKKKRSADITPKEALATRVALDGDVEEARRLLDEALERAGGG